MSQRELQRVHVIRLTLEGRESVGRGAKLLGISARQMKRLRRKMREFGVHGLLHGKRGKSAWNKTGPQTIEKVIGLARGRYQSPRNLPGALQGQRAKKGIFITTSDFTKDANDYAAMIDSRSVLINGVRLGNLMIDHGIGVTRATSCEVKRLASDYRELPAHSLLSRATS